MGTLFGTALRFARGHSRRLVRSGRLPDDLVMGRRWAVTGQPCGIERKIGCLRDVSPKPTLALWGRGGVDRGSVGPQVLGFDIEETLAT